VASPRWIPLRFSGGQKRSDARNRLPRAQQKAQELQKQLLRPVFQLPRRTRSQHLSQNQAQVEPAHVDQLPLQNIFVSAQMAAPQPARFVTMREATLDQLAAPPPCPPNSAAPSVSSPACNCAHRTPSSASPLRHCDSPCPSLFDPNTGVPFGQIQGGREGRIIQLGAKISF